MAEKPEIKLVGIYFTKLLAERNPDFKGKLEILPGINISSIDKFKPDQSKQELLKVSFDMGIDYKEFGKISVRGELFLSADPKTFKEILSDWKDKNHSSDTQVAIMNLIMQKASIKALLLEEEVGLPPHINLPVLRPSKKEDSSK